MSHNPAALPREECNRRGSSRIRRAPESAGDPGRGRLPTVRKVK